MAIAFLALVLLLVCWFIYAKWQLTDWMNSWWRPRIRITWLFAEEWEFTFANAIEGDTCLFIYDATGWLCRLASYSLMDGLVRLSIWFRSACCLLFDAGVVPVDVPGRRAGFRAHLPSSFCARLLDFSTLANCGPVWFVPICRQRVKEALESARPVTFGAAAFISFHSFPLIITCCTACRNAPHGESRPIAVGCSSSGWAAIEHPFGAVRLLLWCNWWTGPTWWTTYNRAIKLLPPFAMIITPFSARCTWWWRRLLRSLAENCCW